MLKKLLKRLKGLFSKPTIAPAEYGRTQSTASIGDKVGNVTIRTQDQLNKHTPFKVGEQYMLGEAVVTLHEDKESMLKAIAIVDARREARHKELTERGIDLMMLTPEELQKLRLDEWLKKREQKHRSLKNRLLSRMWRKTTIKHEAPPPIPEAKVKQAKKVKVKERVG